MKKLLFSIIFLLFSTIQITSVNAETLTLPINPGSGDIIGTETVPGFSLEIDITTLPLDIQINSGRLIYNQTATSTGILKLIDKSNSNIIDSKSLAVEGSKSFYLPSELLKSWISNPASNTGLLLQGADLKDTDQIRVTDLALEINYTIIDTEAPLLEGLVLSEISSNMATVTWQSNEPVTASIMYGKTVNYEKTLEISEAALVAEAKLTGLADGITYHYKIIITDASGNKTESGDQTFTTSLLAGNVLGENITIDSRLAVPRLQELRVKTDSDYTIELTWDNLSSEDLDAIIIYRSPDSATRFEQYKQLDASTQSFIDTSVNPKHTYYYAIRTSKDGKFSGFSNQLGIYVPAVAGLSSYSGKNSQLEQDKTIMLLIGATGLGCFASYMLWRQIKHMLAKKETEQKELRNIFRDPEYYFKSRDDS